MIIKTAKMTAKYILLNFSTAGLLSEPAYYLLCGILAAAVLLGLHMMSKVKKAHIGNKISALAISLGIIITLIKKDIVPAWIIYPAMATGLIIGLILAKRVKMIEMPELVALLTELAEQHRLLLLHLPLSPYTTVMTSLGKQHLL